MIDTAPPPFHPSAAPAPFSGRAGAGVPRRGWGTLEEAATAVPGGIGEVMAALVAQGWCDRAGRPTRQARREEKARWMEAARGWRWRLEEVAHAVRQAHSGAPGRTGPSAPLALDDAAYRSLRAIGRQRQMSAVELGGALRRMGWRTADGTPTVAALACDLAQVRPTAQGRVWARWHGERVLVLLDEHLRREQQARHQAQQCQRLRLGRPPRMPTTPRPGC